MMADDYVREMQQYINTRLEQEDGDEDEFDFPDEDWRINFREE